LKNTSNDQSDNVEEIFSPGGVSMLASIGNGPGRVLGPIHLRDRLLSGTRSSSHADPLVRRALPQE
jgi:hypothetical protein